MEKTEQQYRKKPVVVEAIQFLYGNFEKAKEFCPSAFWLNGVDFTIPTLEGNMKVNIQDWIIKGVNGEFYPCKPDIFEKTYEPASLSSLPSDSEKAARERSRNRAMDFLRWYEHSDYRNTPKTVSELYIIFNTLNPE